MLELLGTAGTLPFWFSVVRRELTGTLLGFDVLRFSVVFKWLDLSADSTFGSFGVDSEECMREWTFLSLKSIEGKQKIKLEFVNIPDIKNKYIPDENGCLIVFRADGGSIVVHF